jgi:hypothetical protein
MQKQLLLAAIFMVPYVFAADDKLTKDARFLIHCQNKKRGSIDVGQLFTHQLVYRYADECKVASLTASPSDRDAKQDECVQEKIELLMQRVDELLMQKPKENDHA